MRPRLIGLALATTTAALLAVGPGLVPAASAADRSIVVRPGDTLSGIAARHGLSVERLVALNRLANPNRIYAGQRIVLDRSPRAAAPAPAARRVHVVRYGEHLTGIARRYATTVSAIVAANHISNPSYIRTGQRLLIPGGSGTMTPARPRSQPKANKPSRTAKPAASIPASMRERVARRADVRRMIASEARRIGVPVSFALAVAWQESGWQQKVVSSSGAIGIMQLLPATGDWVGAVMLHQRVNLRDARSNVRAGVRLLRHYLDRYDGNRSLVLAAYYQGQTAVDRYGIYPMTRPYIASIVQLEKIFR